MYRNLAPQALGLTSCPLNELVELALTHRFGGLEIDLEDFHRQVESRGIASANRYLASAPLKVSYLRLPMDWEVHEADYPQQVERLNAFLPTVKELGCTLLYTHISPGSDFRVYHENFEFHRQKLAEIANLLESHQIRLGLSFSALASDQKPFRQPFLTTFEGLVTLIRTMTTSNVCVMVDLWHWAISQGSLDHIQQLGASRIGDVRLADLPESLEPLASLTVEQRMLPSTEPRIHFSAVIELLQSLDYKGPITPYPHASQFANQRRDVIVRTVAQSLEVLLGASVPEPIRRPVATGSR